MNAMIVAAAYWTLQIVAIFLLRGWLNRRIERLNRELVEVFRVSLHDKETHVRILTYASWRRVGSWLVSFFAVVVVFAVFILDNWSSLNDLPSLDLLVFGTLFCATGIIPWYFTAEANGTAHVVTDRGIAKRSPILKEVFIDWVEVREISYWSYANSFVVKGNGSRISISTVLENIDQFAKLVMERIPAERRREATEMLVRAEKGPFRR